MRNVHISTPSFGSRKDKFYADNISWKIVGRTQKYFCLGSDMVILKMQKWTQIYGYCMEQPFRKRLKNNISADGRGGELFLESLT